MELARGSSLEENNNYFFLGILAAELSSDSFQVIIFNNNLLA